jgi:hypothetical protein
VDLKHTAEGLKEFRQELPKNLLNDKNCKPSNFHDCRELNEVYGRSVRSWL